MSTPPPKKKRTVSASGELLTQALKSPTCPLYIRDPSIIYTRLFWSGSRTC
uniref:Uncharacterized protein n=1 Tax=Anguilla anguilla TaxID=7936 RepID=A0A0E9R2Y2_ANGAN